MSRRIRIVVAFGTRPEAIKLAPVILQLRCTRDVDVSICATGQHRELVAPVLETFGVRPDVDLGVMRSDQQPLDTYQRVLASFSAWLDDDAADFVVVQGDTVSTLAAAQAAFFHQVPVGHVEAGLRSHERYAPFPEEMNRRLVSMLATVHFAPSRHSLRNLPEAVVEDGRVHVTGNTVLDALAMVSQCLSNDDPRGSLGLSCKGRLILATLHRREITEEEQHGLANALASIATRYPGDHVLFVSHPNPTIDDRFRGFLQALGGVRVIEPLPYEEFVGLMKAAYLILTDSGGLQEEAPVLNKPVVVLRNRTDRPESIESGNALLATTDVDSIVTATARLLDSRCEYDRMASRPAPYGDGRAAERIVQGILSYFGRAAPPEPFE